MKMTNDECRTFCRRYIRERLSEDLRDAIEELSAYLSAWLRLRSFESKALRQELGFPTTKMENEFEGKQPRKSKKLPARDEWQDADRTYLSSEQQLDDRLDWCTSRLAAA